MVFNFCWQPSNLVARNAKCKQKQMNRKPQIHFASWKVPVPKLFLPFGKWCGSPLTCGKMGSSVRQRKVTLNCRAVAEAFCRHVATSIPIYPNFFAPVPFGHGYGLWYCVVLPCPSTQQTVALDGLWRQPTTNQLTPYLIKNCTVLLWPQVTWARPESPARCIASPRTLYVVVLHFFTHCPLVGIPYRGVRAYEECANFD